MQKREKRGNQRSSFTESLKLELSITHPSADFPVRTARGVDISTGGVGLEVDYELRKGEVVKLLVPLGIGGTNIPVFAQVSWVETLLEGNYRMGLQFLT